MNPRTARTLGIVVLAFAALQFVGLFTDPTRKGADVVVGALGVVAYALFGFGLLEPRRVPPSWGMIALGVYGATVVVVRFAQGRWLEGGAFLLILALGAYVFLRARRRG